MTKRRKKLQKFYPSIIFISILFMSIGYAIINSVILNLTGELIAQNQTGIFITEAKYVSNNNADVSKSKVLNAYQTMLNTDITLSSTDTTSSITYQISIYNSTTINYKFDGVSYTYGKDTYSNEDITFTLSNLKIGDILESKKTLTFNITFSYKNKELALSPNLISYLTFNFIASPTILKTFDYTGSSQTFVVPNTGIYQLEVWGAQGGSYDSTYYGGYGAYASGEISLNEGDELYINVGGAGVSAPIPISSNFDTSATYNGGGNASATPDCKNFAASGGGATHIASVSGALSSLENQKDKIYIVAAGGGGASSRYCSDVDYHYCSGGNGGGIQGGQTLLFVNSGWTYTFAGGATQTSGGTVGVHNNEAGATAGKFGQGGSWDPSTRSLGHYYSAIGGGGGFYGGGGGMFIGGGGGSSYIGNEKLTNKKMICNNCTESALESTKTISTTQHSATPTSNSPKEGNGYAQISIISTTKQETKQGIYIQSIEYIGGTSVDASKAQITSFSNNEIRSSIDLSSTAANSSITYKVTVYNNDTKSYYYNGLLYELGSDTYSNPEITVSASNISLNAEIPAKSTKTIYLQYFYKDNILAANNNLKSYIELSFQEAICPNNGTICDLSGNNNHLNVVGATWNRYKGEVATDGINDYLYLDLLDFGGTNQFTIEFVALIPKQIDNKAQILFETSLDSNENYGSFYIDTLEYGINDFTLAMKYNMSINHLMADQIVDNNNYRHYTITLNTSNGYDNFTKMYLDATPKTISKTSVLNSDITGLTIYNYPFYIASRAGSKHFTKMYLKELRIYRTALSDTEILSNYNGTIKKENLIASYNFK